LHTWTLSKVIICTISSVMHMEGSLNNKRGNLDSFIQLPAKKRRVELDRGRAVATKGKIAKSTSTTIRIGNSNVKFGKNLSFITDSTDDYACSRFDVLKKRLDEDGVLLIRQMIPQEEAVNARRIIMDFASTKGAFSQNVLNYDYAKIAKQKGKFIEGWTVDAVTGGAVAERDDDFEGWARVGNSDALKNVYDGPYLHKFYEELFQKESIKTFPGNTWIRLKGHGDVTIEHADYYYFKKNTHMLSLFAKEALSESPCGICNSLGASASLISCSLCGTLYHKKCVNYSKTVSLDDTELESSWHCSSCADAHLPFYTCWVSLSNVKTEHSTLGFIPGSHKLSGFNQPPKNKQTPLGFEGVRNSSIWCVPENGLQPGDVFIFNVKTIHAATRNASDEFRISLDTRLYGLS
jgi:hypothetical protein